MFAQEDVSHGIDVGDIGLLVDDWDVAISEFMRGEKGKVREGEKEWEGRGREGKRREEGREGRKRRGERGRRGMGKGRKEGGGGEGRKR